MSLERQRFLRGLLFGATLPVAILVIPLLRRNIRPKTPAPQAESQRSKESNAVSIHPLIEGLVPFRIGETLNYQVQWSAFSSAAAVQLTVPERRELFGWRTWHFRASAHTLNPLRSFVTVDDQFDSYTDATTLESRQYEMYLDEMGQKETQVLRLVPVGQPRRGSMAGVAVLPGTLDPLGALYALRGVDWQRQREFRAPLYDGHDVYQMIASLQVPSETVAVASGNFSATRISIDLFEPGKKTTPQSTFSLARARRHSHTHPHRGRAAHGKCSRRTNFCFPLVFGFFRFGQIQFSGTTQSSGGKSICQNMGEGFTNSMPICAFPACWLPT